MRRARRAPARQQPRLVGPHLAPHRRIRRAPSRRRLAAAAVADASARLAVGAGAVAGTGYALLRNEPALVTARNTGASFGIVALTFCSLQELCRTLRQADDPENSLLARPS